MEKEFKKLLKNNFSKSNKKISKDKFFKTSKKIALNLVSSKKNSIVKSFFLQQNVRVEEDDYALSELIQWIFRSAIRDGKEINLYITSKRMRELLINWLTQQNDCKGE